MRRLTATCVRHPWAVLGLGLLLTAAAGESMLHVPRAAGTDAYLGTDHSAVRELAAFLDTFGGGYPIVIGYECTDPAVCRRAFDPAALEMADAVSRRLERAPHVSRVSSLASTRLLVPRTDLDLEARRFVIDGRVTQDPDLERIALADPLWAGTLVSADGRAGAIVVELTSTETEVLSVVEEVRNAVAPYSGRGFGFHLVGAAVLNEVAQEDGIESAVRAGAATGAMLFLVLLVLVRSLSAVLASLATIGVASAWTMGLLPVFGWQHSVLTNGAASVILVIGCADCVHFVAHYLETRARFADDCSALEATAHWVLAPCFLTTATTVGSFATFASGEVRSLTQFGVMAGLGIAFAFLLTFTLFPALLVLGPPRPRKALHAASWQAVLRCISRFGAERRGIVLGFAFALGAVGAAGISKLRVEMDVANLWDPDHAVTRAIDFISSHFQRADRLEVALALPPDVLLEDPATLHTLASVESELTALDGMGQAQSLLTLLRHTDQLLRPAADGVGDLPESEAGAAELLFLVSSGAPGALDGWLTLDQRQIRLSFEVDGLSMREKERLLARVEARLRAIVPAGWGHSVTGPVALASRWSEAFTRSQANIVSASSLLVLVLIGLYLRSLPWALLAMIPNAIALVFLFGAMGHSDMPLNFGSAIVAPIAIGIAADDTIHFLTAYARERRAGLEPVPALQAAISRVGEAVITTAIALCLGFLSMIVSPIASISSLGLLCTVAIVGATLADLLVLPALILTAERLRIAASALRPVTRVG